MILKDLAIITEGAVSQPPFSLYGLCCCFWSCMVTAMNTLAINHNAALPSLWVKAYPFVSACISAALARVVLVFSWSGQPQIPLPAMQPIAVPVIDTGFREAEQKAVQGEAANLPGFEDAFCSAGVGRGVMRAAGGPPAPLRALLHVLGINYGEQAACERKVCDAGANDLNGHSPRFRRAITSLVLINSNWHGFLRQGFAHAGLKTQMRPCHILA